MTPTGSVFNSVVRLCSHFILQLILYCSCWTHVGWSFATNLLLLLLSFFTCGIEMCIYSTTVLKVSWWNPYQIVLPIHSEFQQANQYQTPTLIIAAAQRLRVGGGRGGRWEKEEDKNEYRRIPQQNCQHQNDQ